MMLLGGETKISLMDEGPNLAYVLADDGDFASVQYKALRGQREDFVRCMRMRYNGRIQLYYLTEGLTSLPDAAASYSGEELFHIVCSLLAAINAVKENGFLLCRNIDSLPRRIYVEPAACKVRLVYLPLRQGLIENDSRFETALRTGLIGLLAEGPAGKTPEAEKLIGILEDASLSWEGMRNEITRIGKEASAAIPYLQLEGLGPAAGFWLQMTGEDFVIGKKEGLADGLIPFNRMISRAHCRLRRREGCFTVADLGSTNGTFVNGQRLSQGKEHPLTDGCILQLADSAFRVKVRGTPNF